MLHNNVQCVTINDANSDAAEYLMNDVMYDTVEYLMDDVIKEFMNECFYKRYYFW